MFGHKNLLFFKKNSIFIKDNQNPNTSVSIGKQCF